MSGLDFAVDPVQDSPEAKTKAQAAEKALYSVYQDNGLEALDYETETDAAVLGDGCYKVTWTPSANGSGSPPRTCRAFSPGGGR